MRAARSPSFCGCSPFRRPTLRINAITCCILSSKWGFLEGKPDDLQGAWSLQDADSIGEVADRINYIYDPTVLALWSGKLDPETGKIGSDVMFKTTPKASQYAKYLLASGVPALPRAEGDRSYEFVQRVFGKIVDGGFFSGRVALRRLDGDVEPSMLAYVPEEICFGPGKGATTDAGGRDPLEYFGTGWSTTMWGLSAPPPRGALH